MVNIEEDVSPLPKKETKSLSCDVVVFAFQGQALLATNDIMKTPLLPIWHSTCSLNNKVSVSASGLTWHYRYQYVESQAAVAKLTCNKCVLGPASPFQA